MNNKQRSNLIANLMESLQNQYNAEQDLFDDEIQVNVTDMRLLDIVSYQQAIIEDLNARLSRLEVFTGMAAPAPLPVAEPVTFAGVDESMSITFAAGGVDYTDNPETAQLDENGDLPY